MQRGTQCARLADFALERQYKESYSNTARYTHQFKVDYRHSWRSLVHELFPLFHTDDTIRTGLSAEENIRLKTKGKRCFWIVVLAVTLKRFKHPNMSSKLRCLWPLECGVSSIIWLYERLEALGLWLCHAKPLFICSDEAKCFLIVLKCVVAVFHLLFKGNTILSSNVQISDGMNLIFISFYIQQSYLFNQVFIIMHLDFCQHMLFSDCRLLLHL